MRRRVLPLVGVGALAVACAAPAPRDGYRLGETGPADPADWRSTREALLTDALRARYPAFFAIVLDPRKEQEPNLLPLRDDLESDPANPASYDALNAVAIAYYELNYRAQSDPGGTHYFADSFRAAKLVAVPWRAYGEIEEPALRDAILDFFEDAASGSKQASASTAPRLLRIVASLAKKETDAGRLARIGEIVTRLSASTADPALD